MFLVESKYPINFFQVQIKTNDVYLVSRLAFNLLSIRSMTDMGLILKFDDKECLIYQGLNKIIG